MLKLIKKLVNIKPLTLAFGIIIIYISLINFFVLKLTPEIIFLEFAILVLLFQKFRAKGFMQTWVPFISFFVLYEVLRSWADDLSPFYSITLYWMYNLEKFLFNGLPTGYLQQIFPPDHIFTTIALLFYSSFFYYSFLVAFIIWLKDSARFPLYSRQFIIFTFVSLLLFFLIPTAPPWLVAEQHSLPLIRYLQRETVLENFSYVTIYQYFFYNNPVAAFPSLHVGWPLFSTLFLIHQYKKKWMYALLIIPIMIGFSIVLTAEHYVVDIVGSLLVILVLFRRKSKQR